MAYKYAHCVFNGKINVCKDRYSPINTKGSYWGAVQGSVLGVLDHNVVLDDLDDNVNDSVYIAKYVDDMTMIETVKNTVPTTINTENIRPLHCFEPQLSSESFSAIKRSAENEGLKINDSSASRAGTMTRKRL